MGEEEFEFVVCGLWFVVVRAFRGFFTIEEYRTEEINYKPQTTNHKLFYESPDIINMKLRMRRKNIIDKKKFINSFGF